MKKKDSVSLSKIEVDEKTAEPTIIQLIEKTNRKRKQKQKEILDTIKLSPDKVKEPDMKGQQLSIKQAFIESDSITNKKQRIFKKLFYILFVVFMLSVIAVTAYKDFFATERAFPKWAELVDIFTSTWFYMPLSLLALFLCFFFKGLKLSLQCKALTGKWHLKTCLETGIVGLYYNNVTPLGSGGQPFEIYYLSKHGVHGGVAAALPIATFFMYQFSYLVMGIFCVISLLPAVDIFQVAILHPELIKSGAMVAARPMAIIGLIFTLLMPTLVIIFCIMPRVCSKLVHWIINLGAKLKLIKNPKKTIYSTLKNVVHNSKCLKAIMHNPLVLIISLLIGFLEILASSSIAFFTLKFFGFDLYHDNFLWEWAVIIQFSIILTSAISFIPTPGNSGAADSMFFSLFSPWLRQGLAFPSMMIWRFLSYYAYILIGLIFTNLKKSSDKRKTKRNF